MRWFESAHYSRNDSALRAVAIRCLGIQNPNTCEGAFGVEINLFWRKADGVEPMALQTKSLDVVSGERSLGELQFEAAILALEAWMDLPVSMRSAPLRIVTCDANVAHVLTNLGRRERTENVPTSCVSLRDELLRLVDECRVKPWVQFLSAKGVRRSKKWGRAFSGLEKRLLYRVGLNRRVKSNPSLELSRVGDLLRESNWASRRSPPVLGVLVDLVVDEVGYGELSELLGVDRKRLYDARTRWKSKAGLNDK